MSDLQKLLPRSVFETSYTDEVFLDGFHSSLCEFVPTEAENTSSFAQLLRDINEKDLALTIPLNDGGCLILLHPSNFLRYDDTESTAAEVLQGIFVFPESRVVRRDISFGKEHPAVAPEILQFVPVLNYAEGEVEKASVDPSEELCEVLMPHMHTYATLINPGLAESPSREVNIFPDQYDVAESHEHIYSSPEWTKRALQSIKSYLSKPACFQLPVSKVSEILAAGQEEQREELVDDVDDVYIHLSSPEGAPASPFDIELEDRLSDQETQTVVPHDARIYMLAMFVKRVKKATISLNSTKLMTQMEGSQLFQHHRTFQQSSLSKSPQQKKVSRRRG
ncbi:protein TASOR-like [Cololabis saira]|uniref:protein TASOR-like n=1 Tax=Cololabis saira TaxID=129043 RepID=UPI002AD31712|nr:protein TASOR-like [Cololabis saira]